MEITKDDFLVQDNTFRCKYNLFKYDNTTEFSIEEEINDLTDKFKETDI